MLFNYNGAGRGWQGASVRQYFGIRKFNHLWFAPNPICQFVINLHKFAICRPDDYGKVWGTVAIKIARNEILIAAGLDRHCLAVDALDCFLHFRQLWRTEVWSGVRRDWWRSKRLLLLTVVGAGRRRGVKDCDKKKSRQCVKLSIQHCFLRSGS